MKITLLYQVSHYIRVQKQRNIKSWDQQNYLVIRGFCYIRPLYNEVPLYFQTGGCERIVKIFLKAVKHLGGIYSKVIPSQASCDSQWMDMHAISMADPKDLPRHLVKISFNIPTTLEGREFNWMWKLIQLRYRSLLHGIWICYLKVWMLENYKHLSLFSTYYD